MRYFHAIRNWLVLLFLLFSLQACRAHIQIPKSEQDKLTARYKSHTLWLKQSLYGGKFYDHTRYKLAYPYTFETLTIVQTPDGKPVLPPKENEIIPVGTRVSVEYIEWPTLLNQMKRPLYSPRTQPWVYVKLGRARGNVDLNRDQSYVLLAPPHIKDANEFVTWFETFASFQDTNTWLLEQDEAIREGILSKQPVLGMNETQLKAALGEPTHISRRLERRVNKAVTRELVSFANVLVVLEDGKVHSF